MNDFGAFLAACFSSPALLTSTCATLVVPTLAWVLVRGLRPSLARMGDDPSWQAALAVGAAAVPGTLFVVIAAVTLSSGWGSVCLHFATGRALYGTVAALAMFGLSRATWLSARRSRDLWKLLRSSYPARDSVRAASEAAAIHVREIDASGPMVLVGGIFRPVVFISTEAIRRVNDAELLAAVRHEAAHARRGDLLCAAIVTFVADVVPLPVDDLIALFRRAREFAADAHAIRVADRCDLASALLSLARPGTAGRGLAAFADGGTVGDRLGALLTTVPARPSLTRRYALTAALAMTLLLGSTPVFATIIFGFTCAMAMPT